MRLVKERHPPLRDKELHHFTKHLHVQVRVLGALTPTQPPCECTCRDGTQERTPLSLGESLFPTSVTQNT